MLGILGINKWVMIGGAVLIMSLVTAIYVQKKWHDAEVNKKDQLITELNAKLVTEKIAHESLKRNVEFMQESLEIQREEKEILEDKIHQANAERRRLKQLFEETNLEKLSKENPQLAEQIINETMRRILQELEETSK